MNIRRFLLALTFAVTVFPVLGLHAEAPKKLRVFVPVLPYEYLFERVGGNWINVSAIVQEGGDCHNYSPSPRQITDISRANLLFSGGLSFEGNFFVAVGDGINSPKEINLSKGIELLEGSCEECEKAHTEGREPTHKHETGELKDMHVWLSPRVLLHQATRVAAILKDKTTARIVLEGHTDNVGARALNQTLSEDRAARVRRVARRPAGVGRDERQRPGAARAVGVVGRRAVEGQRVVGDRPQ